MMPLLGYIAVIVLANWAISTFGIVPVGFGLAAPADTGQAAPAQTDALHTCPCFKHADARAAAGITPPPIVIGGHALPVKTGEDRADDDLRRPACTREVAS